MALTITPERQAALRADGRAAAQAGHRAQPALSPTWWEICAEFEGEAGSHLTQMTAAANCFHAGYREVDEHNPLRCSPRA